MQEAGRISDSQILAGMIDSVELEKRAKELDISSYTRLEQLFILTIQEVISQSGVNLQESDCALLLSTTKGNIDLLSNQEKELIRTSQAILYNQQLTILPFYRNYLLTARLFFGKWQNESGIF